ncbi:MAG: ABC transporter substrate-binding protein [Planctomycetes bacterium]|nr:ABC transporter substrate-binding protein [Planctomycetota bacterium]
MWQSLQRLSLGMFLILLASAVLLLSESSRPKDRQRPPDGTAAAPARVMRVAMFQMASQPILDEGAQGVLDGLQEAGYVDKHKMRLTRFNAEGDVATGNAIAQELVGGEYDLIITLTTGALQAVANANQSRKIPHVFGLVSDPVKAGVGIGTGPMEHPDHLVGIGTFPPVDQALEMAKKLNPKLSRIGLAWNPAEVNSEVCTILAREVCQKLKIELVEANVDSTSAVKEAIGSLLDRQVDALLVGGDVTMLGAMDVVAKSAADARIPVFTCMPGNALKGALFDVGANYYEVGRTVGKVASRVLNGESIAKIPVEIAIPPKLFLNTLALKNLRDSWPFPAELIQQADSYIDEQGRHDKPKASQPLSKKWEVRILSYVTSQDVDEAIRGLKEGLTKSGLVEERDYALKVSNAQGDMAVLAGSVDAAISDHTDMILTVSTQALQASMQRAKDIPIVFTMVANPFAAGAGKSDSEHLSNVTGAYGANDVQRMMPIIRQVLPDAQTLGTLYVPAEINSVYSYELLVDAARAAKYELKAVGVTATNEVPDGAQSLCQMHLDAVCLSNSNITGATFPNISRVAREAKLPVFAFMGSTASQGASIVLTRDYYDMGVDSAQLAAKVMRGNSVASIPFHQSTKSRLIINVTAARASGLTLPESLLKSADRILEK